MSDQDRVRWDARYSISPPNFAPAPLVTQMAPAPAPGARALDVACGAGRHTLYLAEVGYTVEAVDISPVGLRQLLLEAAHRGLAQRIIAIPADLDVWRPDPARYRLVVQVGFFDAALWPHVVAAVAPGGRLIVEGFNRRRLLARPDTNPAFLLTPTELTTALRGWRILHARDDAGEAGDRSQMVAERPL